MLKVVPTTSFAPAPPPPREEFVYETVKEAILSGQLAPGDSLVQTEIAQQLGVSHIPLRGAINRLIAEGLVIQEPHRSPKVSQLTAEGFEEILLIRMHLEVLATREAVPHLQPEQLATLRSLVQEMDDALAKEELPTYGILNKRYHLALYEACPYRLLQQMISDLWNNSDRFRSRAMFVLVPSLARQSQRDHVRLLELIEAGDVDEAVDLMEKHKARARSTFVKSLRQAL